ncbi:MAG: SDR family NAD(P)-dependent oxidoreductase [Candidatus Omnitrophota bacterium]
MRQFAFIIHSLDIGGIGIAFNEPKLINIKPTLVKKALEWLPSFTCAEVTGIKSSQNLALKGHLIYCALLAEQMISLDGEFVLNRVISAAKIAQDLGADILGLGAYAAQIGRKGVAVAKAVKIPVTTGTHYTIHIAIESVLQAADKVGLDISKANIAIIGATGGIGQVCAKLFSEKAAALTLVARNKSRLDSLKEQLQGSSKTKIIIEDDIKKAIRDSNIAIMSTTTPYPLIDVDELEPGALICDISRPRNVSQKRISFRKDVLVIDGGIVMPPGEPNFNFYIGIPAGLAYACLAETMILALEEKYESFSLGGKLSTTKVKEIAELGKKHGFNLAEIRSFDTVVPDEIFNNIKKINAKRKK